MKRIVSLLLALCLTLAAPLAMAADQPFKEGVNYSEEYSDESKYVFILEKKPKGDEW